MRRYQHHKRIVFMRARIVPALGALALLAACSGQPEASKTSETPKDETAAASGELKAVVMGEKPLYQKQGDSYEGLGVDVLQQIKGEAGLEKLNFITADGVDDGLNAVKSGKADIACGVAFTWERARTFSFSLPFAIGGTRLLADGDIDGTPESLEGKTIGVVENSAAAKVLSSVVPGVELTSFKTPDDALKALADNKLQALGGGSLWLATSKGDSGKMLVPARPYGRSGISCIVSQDNGKLLSSANLAIGQMMQAYIDGDAGSREEINRWIGPDSEVMLSEAAISALYSVMLASTAEISTNVKAPSDAPTTVVEEVDAVEVEVTPEPGQNP